ncbi:hypothetical protein FQN57_005273 [Myotisia sp. PD_48]|nr:hypothetical protein FQN57_005273 [Myotisia sp. PD_48]
MSFLDSPFVSNRPKSSAHSKSHSSSSSPASQWYDDQTCEQPPMSSSMTLPDSPSRFRNRTRTESPKRLSVFGLRSRSNTGTSSSSSYNSPASSLTSAEPSSQRSSQDDRNLSSFMNFQDKEESLAKSLFSRGSRMLRRQGSKFSLSASLTLEEEEEMARNNKKNRDKGKESDGVGVFHRSHRTRHSDMHEFLKRNISEPFNFQHVTHTNPGQLPPIEHTHLNDLATEFSIIRASQKPNAELKGIHAESLSSRGYPVDEESDCVLGTLAPDAPSLFSRSPPASPETVSPQRMSRSVENFSRPVSRLQRKLSSPSIIPPPRISSKPVMAEAGPDPTTSTINLLIGLNSPSASSESLASHHEPVGYAVSSPRLDFPEAPPEEIGRAFSPDSANVIIPLPSPLSHRTGLADVPEEDENASRRNSQATGPAFKISNPDVAFDGHLQPRMRNLSISSPPTQQYQSAALDTGVTTTSQDFQRHEMRSIPSTETISGQPPQRSESWEDDIDYCYEHAAESNSNFDWHRRSLEELASEGGLQIRTEKNPSPREGRRGLTTAPVVASGLQSFERERSGHSIPDSQAPSVVITSTRRESVSPISGITSTRRESVSPISEGPYGYFPSTIDSPHKPKAAVIKVLDSHYEDESADAGYSLVPEIHGGEEQYHHQHSAHIDEQQVDSARSSCSPLSKCNSQESIMLSRAASTARKHRSSTSTNSVPDLIHSPSCSRENITREASDGLVELPRVMATRPPVSPIHARSQSQMAFSGSSMSSRPALTHHDRTRSTSILDTYDTSSQRNMQPGRPRASTLTRNPPTVRKGRASYSLFPTAGKPAPR